MIQIVIAILEYFTAIFFGGRKRYLAYIKILSDITSKIYLNIFNCCLTNNNSYRIYRCIYDILLYQVSRVELQFFVSSRCQMESTENFRTASVVVFYIIRKSLAT
jgi:hypothetical protein